MPEELTTWQGTLYIARHRNWSLLHNSRMGMVPPTVPDVQYGSWLVEDRGEPLYELYFGTEKQEWPPPE